VRWVPDSRVLRELSAGDFISVVGFVVTRCSAGRVLLYVSGVGVSWSLRSLGQLIRSGFQGWPLAVLLLLVVVLSAWPSWLGGASRGSSWPGFFPPSVPPLKEKTQVVLVVLPNTQYFSQTIVSAKCSPFESIGAPTISGSSNIVERQL